VVGASQITDGVFPVTLYKYLLIPRQVPLAVFCVERWRSRAICNLGKRVMPLVVALSKTLLHYRCCIIQNVAALSLLHYRCCIIVGALIIVVAWLQFTQCPTLKS